MNKGDIHLHLRIPRQVALCTISLLVGGALFSIGTALADGLTSTQTVLGSDLIMPYDGYLMVDSSPLTGARTIKFDLYQDATGGTVVWTETQTVNLYNGRFSVGLGSGTSLTSTILDAEKLYLAMTVIEADAQGNTVEIALSGRQAIEPAPFAAWAGNAADFNVDGKLDVAGGADITGDTNVTGSVIATVSLEGADATISGTTTTQDFVVNGSSEIGNGYSQDHTILKGVDNDGSDSALTIQSAADQIMLLDGNEIDTLNQDLYLQNNTNNDVRVGNDLQVSGGIYNATVLDLADNSNILDVNLIRGYNDILFRGQQSSSSNDMKLTSGGDLEVYNDLEVDGTLTVNTSITGTLNSSCPGTTFAEDYVSGSNTRMCVYEMTTARNWPESAARCYGNFNGAELCTYSQIRAMVSHGGMTFDGNERWLGDVTLDDEAIYTNRAISGSSDSDINNFEGDGDMDGTKRAFCCLKITN